MSDSCHLDRASNVKIGVESQTIVIVIFLTAAEVYKLGYIQGIIRVNNSKEITFSDLYYFQV